MTTVTMPAMQLQAPAVVYDWLAIDIETANGRPEAAERWARTYWTPNAAWKDETIGRRWREAVEKKVERLALLDESPVIAVSLRSESELRCLHAMQHHCSEPTMVHNALVEAFASESDMLLALRSLLDARIGDATAIVGHNIRAFDLPKLRSAYICAGVRLPAALARRDLAIFDTMTEYVRRFSIQGGVMIALDDVLEGFGMDSHKSTMGGAMVPELYEQGAYKTIIEYALLDVLAESEVFQRMAGIAGQ